MISPSRSPPVWSCAQCTLLNPICSDSCEACEAPRPLDVDADSPVVMAAAPSLPPRRCNRKREHSPAVEEAKRPMGIHADSPVVVVDASASPPLRCRTKRERSPAVAEADPLVEFHEDTPTVVIDASASPPLRCGKKRERSPAGAEAEPPVEVHADTPTFVVDASASSPRRGGKKSGRSPSPVVAEAEPPVEVHADTPTVVVDASASPPGRCGTKRERSPAVAEADAPVEVHADTPTVVVDASASPPRRCGTKRERAASSDVVELCDSAGRGGDGESRAAKKANLGIHLDKKTFKIMTYNVWFREDMELSRRMDALGDLIMHHSPDFICFQEVTPYIHLLMQNSKWWQQYKCLLSQEMANLKPYYCMQLSKVRVEPSECIPFFNSKMGRELCISSISTGEMMKLVIATTHLESPCPAPPKWDQMYSKERVDQAKKSLEILGRFRNAILCGDMNWDDKGDGPFPLQDGWIDAWVELKPGDNGWTYDTKANGMLSGNRKLQKRMDRFLCKLEDFKIDNIDMIGKEALPGISYFKEKKVWKEIRKIELPVFPSDHFGLVLTITKQGDDSF